MVGACSGAIDMHVMVLDHQHHDECGTNRVDDRFKSKYRQPCAVVPLGQNCVHRERHQKDAGMEAWHDDSGRARISRPASLSPKLDRDEKRVNRDDHGTENLAITIIKYAWNLPDPQPDG